VTACQSIRLKLNVESSRAIRSNHDLGIVGIGGWLVADAGHLQRAGRQSRECIRRGHSRYLYQLSFRYNRETMNPWHPGMRLGPYELLAPLGAGGMGEVWKARDSRLGRTVAIKRFKGAHEGRFNREAQLIAALNHPHICQVYDVGTDYLVLEYIEGQPLPCPMAPDEAVSVAMEIARAIEAAHARGIIHRDLKPANILMTRDRSIKLLDFGLAKLTGDAGEATVTMEGSVLGTPAYMSPEQAQGKPLDERSDVFSFGAVLYEMLSGNRAFGGETTAQVLSGVLHHKPAPLLVAPAVERVLRRCLAKRPEERFQNMSEVRKALEAIPFTPVVPPPSVAVLPFSTMSPDRQDEYFSDGLAEEIINALAHIPGLNVTARTSSFAFRGKDLDIRKVAEALGVRTILEGSVRRAANRIRVTAQLINAANGYNLWSERYDREMADVFAIQDDIAQAIAAALKVRLSSEQSTRRYTPEIPAYEAFLKGRYLTRKSTPQSLAQAKAALEQAIALAPEFALAHAELAAYYTHLSGFTLEPARTVLPLARAAAQRALEIDPLLPEAHAELAAVAAFLDYDWGSAGHHFRMAIARDPIPASVRHRHGFFYLMPLGRIAEAIEELERSLKDDPLNAMCRTQIAVLNWTAGRYEEASRQFRYAQELDERFWLVWLAPAVGQADIGAIEPAVALAERAHAVAPADPTCIGALAGLLSRQGDFERAKRLLDGLGDTDVYGAPLGLAVYHQVRQEFDQMAGWLEKAIEQRHPSALPAACTFARRRLIANGSWLRLARLLRLPEAATGDRQ
jgi:serine/threonine-protein kinase